ncbi:MAG: hypothetical protein JWO96_200 [Candidatus Saccharibacteria bacterium]|nr:hypothetical protein [Candidatus Saccharibacteria bacterium]
MIAALSGKVGYILGGIEKVTDKVLESADELKAIVFTGTAYKGFIPGWELAAKKGIAIANAPHANADAVAEWAFTAALAMTRNLFALGRTGDKTFQTIRGISEQQVGIVGFGHVGSRLADLFSGAGAKKVAYWSKSEKESSYQKMELDELLKSSDIICFCVSGEAGTGWLNKEKLSAIKDEALITCLTDSVVNEEDLLVELQNGRLRAFLDWTPEDKAYKDLPLDVFYCSNESTAYNTFEATKRASDWATESLLNLLDTGTDKHKVVE